MVLSIHMLCALISISLFIWRGIAMWTGHPLTNKLYRRTLPDSVDTLFLITGISMAWTFELSFLEDHWLTAKIIGLLIYIVLGSVALHFGQSTTVKRSSFIAALAVFAYIIAVASTKQVMPL